MECNEGRRSDTANWLPGEQHAQALRRHLVRPLRARQSQWFMVCIFGFELGKPGTVLFRSMKYFAFGIVILLFIDIGVLRVASRSRLHGRLTVPIE